MAVLDNAVWINAATGYAESGSTPITEGGLSTTVTGTFTANAWDETQSGYNISEFGAFGVTSPITANYQFSEPVENFTFDFNHVNDDGGSTYDDSWTIYAYDEGGTLIDSADIIAALSGIQDETVYANPDGSVTIEATGTTANDVTFLYAGYIGELELVFEPGPNGSSTGGSGISDFTFDLVDTTDTDGDGVWDIHDIDDDNDGILDSDEGSAPTPYTHTTGQVDILTDGGASTDSVDLSSYGVSIGDTVTIDNILADGDLNGSTETFTLDFNSGEHVTGNLQTGLQNAGSLQPLTAPQSFTVTVVDIGGGVPGLIITADASAAVNALGGNPALSYTLDISGTVGGDVDTDGDGIVDRLDLDSDNDGITDNVEAQLTSGYVAPSGVDSDGDGLDDAYEGTGDEGLTPVDSDGDGTADYLDSDSDGDGISDTDEAGHGESQATIDGSGDSDGDGIMDAVDDVAGWDVNDADIDGSGNFTLADTDFDTDADGSNAAPPTIDLDYRDTVPCFATGTMILTAAGERPVETLRPGDLIETVDDGPVTLRWVASTTMSAEDLARLPSRRPVIIRNGALGNRRRMLVSQQHAFLMRAEGGERLMRVKHVRERYGGQVAHIARNCREITYYHLMFDRHQLVRAEGSPAESFYPGPLALRGLDDEARAELLRLFPRLGKVLTHGQTAAQTYGRPVRPYLKRHEIGTRPARPAPAAARPNDKARSS